MSGSLRMRFYSAHLQLVGVRGEKRPKELSVPKEQQQNKAYANVIRAESGFIPSWWPNLVLQFGG